MVEESKANGPPLNEHGPQTVGDASPAMRFAHILMVSTAIAFAFGYAIYLLVIQRARVPEGGSSAPTILGAVASCLVGSVLIRYLRSFLERSRATGRAGEGSGGESPTSD